MYCAAKVQYNVYGSKMSRCYMYYNTVRAVYTSTIIILCVQCTPLLIFKNSLLEVWQWGHYLYGPTSTSTFSVSSFSTNLHGLAPACKCISLCCMLTNQWIINCHFTIPMFQDEVTFSTMGVCKTHIRCTHTTEIGEKWIRKSNFLPKAGTHAHTRI